jgi:sulfite exporter TauE/SafE
MTSGDAFKGSMVMFYFGVGTLPAMFATSMSGQFIHDLFSQHWLRKLISLLMIISAITMLIWGLLD